ncbi:S41 family peptidase [Kordia algicida OT-1]|uniref:Putative carboxy-terminal protease n=1 Tax=Kordia algicida OT-1 TaxID=391587 RepID=A9DN34_9FLAO|nr:S41 family peptidase [Kordia algicida]EDP97104.1 putative carboxy-terminal protease [Kordia algicida OT-1]
MNKTTQYLLPVIIAAAVAAGVFIGGKLNFSATPETLFSSNTSKDKLNRLIDYIDYEYVDEVNVDSIVDVTVTNILENLDPHSIYIPSEDEKRIAENMQGDFVGVGIRFDMVNDTLTVVRTLEGGPSVAAGIKAGDRILMADNDTLYGKKMRNTQIISKLKGAENTFVNLKIYRKQTDKIFNINLQRAKVPIQSVVAHYMLTDDLGYIKINRFAETTYDEFVAAMKALQQQGAKNLTLDLRNNPGGILDVTRSIADEFLEDGKLILFTKNKKGEIDKYYATDEGDFEDGEIYVLINEKSASASEIIAGALQDNDKGVIVGRRSFGKGLVQRPMPLGDGSVVRLTISRYYTPTGRSIQRSYKNGNKDYFDEYYARFKSGELKSIDSIKVADSLKFETPKGKIVYGGGGIIPDVFVPLSSTPEEISLERGLRAKIVGYINDFVFNKLDADRAMYSNMKFKEFMDNFEVSDDLLEEYTNFLSDMRGQRIYIEKYATQIKRHIKAVYIEQLFGINGYQQQLNEGDEMIAKVLELQGK